MRTIESTSGKAHTTDEDYTKFSGRVVQKHVHKLGVTLDGFVIGRVTRVIDLGRADPVEPLDIVEAMLPIDFEYEPNTDAACRTNRARHKERFARLQMDVIAYLQRRGPSYMTIMANDLEQAKTTLDQFIRKREGTVFCRVGNVGRAVLWGLIGIHNKEAA